MKARHLLLLLLCGGTLGCPLTHGTPEPYKCYSDEDCYSNEYCAPQNKGASETGECRAKLDSSVPDHAVPRPDLKRSEGLVPPKDVGGHE